MQIWPLGAAVGLHSVSKAEYVGNITANQSVWDPEPWNGLTLAHRIFLAFQSAKLKEHAWNNSARQ